MVAPTDVTLVQGSNPSSKQFDPSLAPSRAYPSEFADQMNSTASPLYLDSSLPNAFLHFPPGTSRGMESFASAVGLRPQDLFGTCLVLFLCLAAGIVAVSLLIWFTHGMLTYVLSPSALGIDPATSGGKAKRSSWGKKSMSNSGTATTLVDDSGYGADGKKYASGTAFDSVPPTPGVDVPMLQTGRGAVQHTDTANAGLAFASRSSRKRHWWRFKIKGPIGAYHYSALCGRSACGASGVHSWLMTDLQVISSASSFSSTYPSQSSPSTNGLSEMWRRWHPSSLPRCPLRLSPSSFLSYSW